MLYATQNWTHHGMTYSGNYSVFTALLVVKEVIAFQYLFAIFNSLQGFFLFLFYCVLKRDVQLAWMHTCPCFDYERGYTSTNTSQKLGNGKYHTVNQFYNY